MISPVTPSDHQELLAVWEDSVRATHDFITEADIAYFKPIIIEQAFPNVTLHCVKNSDANIVGFIGVHDRKIEMLFVLDKSRRQGVGTELLHFALETQNVQFVDVNEQNPEAVGFYEAKGFEVYERSPTDDMGKPYPILRMRLLTSA
ncbi:GNAT family N-acetyltransferase [Pseudoalteromonas sp. JC28]|uniref:GNAT family N-acetyltransferase n=1 Tax=Pseudoalteromonas sp. JC28 TaxID=2267617 RepID=UPI001C2D880E|nr:GNAT family N-acetyltransferase [Pseudoalteromonas sp. JC28]NSY33843.1 GNAT family N-acetyltransferase [Pseudoalteromonas sp. JC28]